jgi:phosphonatase-like hydrolase
MNLELVVFDVAGTTVVDDDNVADALREALLDVGVETGRDACVSVMGLAKPAALRALCADRVESHDLARVVASAHGCFVERMIHHYSTSAGVRAIDGAEATFEALREEGIAVALDTGFSRPVLDAILLRLGWYDDVVDFTVTSDEVEAGRPHPFMIRRAMSLAGVSTVKNVMKVGDTVADMREGVEARVGTIVGVLSGSGQRDELLAAGATAILADVATLPRLIFGTPKAAPMLLRDRLFGT